MILRKMFPKVLDILNQQNVVLASSSPRRLDMLKQIGLNVSLVPSTFEENYNLSDFANFMEFVEETALGKVDEVYQRLTDNGEMPDIIIGADTMVTLNGEMYGKPKTKEDAFQTLKTLTGNTHVVYSGVAIKTRDKVLKFTESTSVSLDKLSDEDIWAYIETGEPMDKAGAYGIQGIGSVFVKKIDGDYYTVLGLPIYKLVKELSKLIRH